MSTEANIEQNLINQLTQLKYIYRNDIVNRKSLEENFKKNFEALNLVTLSDSEFSRLRDDIITTDVFIASKKLREINFFLRDDNTPLHYTLVNIKDWCKNNFEVINQLRVNTENSYQKYDVILLINGLPVVQIELKKLDVTPRKAMQQIVDYKKDIGNGYTNSLMCFMQLFIVSNTNRTFYFTNNQNKHFSFNADEQFLPVYELADENNKKINYLDAFADKFLKKCTIAELISKYMVLVESEQKLLIMRPYQIYAVKAIIDSIEQNRGNGYIWHTTGSGKTLTSFKASTLLKNNPDIEKCLFVVDRKDLDRQTRQEFNKFQENCVEENTNTETLVKRLLSTDYADKVIVTTIQKLGIALDGTNTANYKQLLKPLQNKRIVFIFDECHRSQFGDNNKAIKEFFPNAQLFGFTGTPIFDVNATVKGREFENEYKKTTADIFQQKLHSYTITHAIADENVLRFHIDYFKANEQLNANPEQAITQQAVIDAILKKHNAATNSRRFNAIFATSSINNAIEYYALFKSTQAKLCAENPEYISLNIACVFSPPAQLIAKDKDQNSQKNAADIKQLQEDLIQEKEDNKQNPEEKKKALMDIIADYNANFKTNHTINEFDIYYQDVQKRIKDQQYPNKDLRHHDKIDITIVVDMLLTGFDSKYLNTLYVDKNLKYHGLIQAFSRTNRVLNNTKPYGNILDFRSQQKEVDDAIELFSGDDKNKARKIWLVDLAPVVIEQYKEAVQKLGVFMQDQDLVNEPEAVYNLRGDAAQIAFINNFKAIQGLKTKLDQYTDLDDKQKTQIEAILSTENFLNFRSSYIETARKFKKIQDTKGNKAPANIQQLDFEFVLFASDVIDYDYIMNLIAKNTQNVPQKQKMTKQQVISLLSSNANFMDELDDLKEFINQLNWEIGHDAATLQKDYLTFRKQKSQKEIADIANKHGLETTRLKTFIDNIINRMIFDGETLTDLLAPLELGWKDRRQKELALMEDLVPQLIKFAQGRKISGLAAYE